MRAPSSGFTLLELLLAISVLGMVAGMLSLSLGGVVKLKETTEQQETMASQVQTGLRRINEDLNGAVQLKEEPFVGTAHELARESADTLSFPSRSHLVFNPEKQNSGLAFIRYRVEPDAEDPRKLKLLRADTLLLPKEKDHEQESSRNQASTLSSDREEREGELAFLLIDNLRSVRFRYLDHKGQEFDSWQVKVEEGKEGAGPPLPAAVLCTLEIWLDVEKELSQTVTTGMIVPIGLMPQETSDEQQQK